MKKVKGIAIENISFWYNLNHDMIADIQIGELIVRFDVKDQYGDYFHNLVFNYHYHDKGCYALHWANAPRQYMFSIDNRSDREFITMLFNRFKKDLQKFISQGKGSPCQLQTVLNLLVKQYKAEFIIAGDRKQMFESRGE